MIKTFRAFLLIILCAGQAAFAQNGWEPPRPEHGLNFSAPATVWDEALPLGNGMIGALVWGDGHPLRISIDRADLWDLRLVPEYHTPEYTFNQMRRWHEEGRKADLERLFEKPYERAAPTKIPAGRIEISFAEASHFKDTQLNLRRGLASMRFQEGASFEAFVHATEPVGMMNFKTAGNIRFRLIAPPFSGQVKDAAKGGITAGDLQQLGYSSPVETSGENWQAYTQTGWNNFRFAVFIAWKKGASNCDVAWSIASSFEGADPLSIARGRVERALEIGYVRMKLSHERWWEQFWRQSSVRVPNQVIERQWFLDTYKFGAAARRGAPPISLQAIWTADNGQLPPWKGDFHHDLNTQLSYWPAYAGNHLEEGLSYLDWLWKTRDAGKSWTKRFFGLPGLNVPMTADLNGNPIGGWRQYTHSATTAAWLAQHFYLHWRYSGDRRFLRQRAYPYLRDASVFIEAFTSHKDPDGKRTHPLSSSPEINDNKPTAWFPTVTNYDLALDRWLIGATAELAADLGKQGEAEHWRRVLSEFPDFALGEDAQLLVASGYPLKQSHRHFSHLMAIYPLALINRSNGADEARIISSSLKHLEELGTDNWVGYSFAWLTSLAARAGDGEKAERALEIFSTAFTLRNSFHCNGDQSGRGYSKFTYRPFTLEGNFAAATGLQEMLLQSGPHQTITLFPAIPKSWANASFTRFRADGGFLISAKLENRAITFLEIVAGQEGGGGHVRVASPLLSKEIELRLKKGEKRSLRKLQLE